MNRTSPILFAMALLGLLLISCGDTPVDSKTASVTFRDSVVIRDSIRIADSTHIDTVDIPRDLYRRGMIYFKLNGGTAVVDSLPLEIDFYTYALVQMQAGVPKQVAIRMMARVPGTKPALVAHGLPFWMYLNVDKVVLSEKLKGERGLESDPRNNLTGLVVSPRLPWTQSLLTTDGPNHGHLQIDTVMLRERRVHASFTASLGSSPALPIDSVAIQLGF
ncbi:MAG: hypothetical protein ABIR47_03710 [Candidatus Kapaibacterium sp.]